MSHPPPAVLLVVFDAFRDAVRDKASREAEALCTRKGWLGRGDAAGRFYRRAARLGHVPSEASAGVMRDERATLAFTDGEGHASYALMQREPEVGWALVALTVHPVRSALHLMGTLDPLVRTSDLPDSDRAAAWARSFSAQGSEWKPSRWPTDPVAVSAVEKLRELASEAGTRIDRIGEHSIEGAERWVAGLRFTRRRSDVVDEVWVVLERDGEGGLAPARLAWSDDLGELLAGIPLDWKAEVPEVELAPAEVSEDPGLTPRDVLAVFDAARTRLEETAGKRIPEQDYLLNAVRVELARLLRRRRAAVGEPPPLDLSSLVRDAVGKAAGGGDVVVDRHFVADHGKDMLGAMIGAFTKALRAPEERVEADPNAPTVAVDVVDLVGSLLPGGPDDD